MTLERLNELSSKLEKNIKSIENLADGIEDEETYIKSSVYTSLSGLLNALYIVKFRITKLRKKNKNGSN